MCKSIGGILLISILLSCGNRNNSSKLSSNLELLAMVERDSNSTVYSTYNEDSILFRIYTNKPNNRNPFLLSDEKNYIVMAKYKYDNDKITILKQDTLLLNEYVYVDIGKNGFEPRNILEKKYICFLTGEEFMGSAILEKCITFYAISIDDFKFYALKYEGIHSIRCKECIDGVFLEDSCFQKENPDIYHYLYKYAQESGKIYVPIGTQKDPMHPINFEEKWRTDNGTIDIRFANANIGILDTIYSTYYKQDLNKLIGETCENDQIIESDHYKVINHFRNDIIGYNKIKNLYFPIVVESCISFCNKSVKFISEDTIEVTYDEDDGKKYGINLGKIIYTNKDMN